MESILGFLMPLLGLEGQWHGAAAVALVLTGIVIFMGTIYVLLAMIYGWWQAYLVTMVALMAFSIILAAVWLVGIPGTIPGTGPRGTEPHWVPFLADSETGQQFRDSIDDFPKTGTASANGWLAPDPSHEYPGEISPEGELDTLKGALLPALAGYFQAQETGSSRPEDYQFRIAGRDVATEEEEKVTPVRIFFKPEGEVRVVDPKTEKLRDTINVEDPAARLVVGISYPAVRNANGEVVHPAFTVFAFRDKGRVYESALIWMVVSILLFALHLFWLARYEDKQARRQAQLAAGERREPVTA